MLKFARKRYKSIVLWLRRLSRVISQNINTPFGVAAIIGFLCYITITYYGLNILLGLVYDDEVAELIDIRFLIYLPIFLASTLYFNFVLMIKIIWERLRHSPGTLLRFRIIGFFFLSIVLPAVLFIYVFNIVFERSIDIFDDQAILRNIDNKKWALSQTIDRYMGRMNDEFDKQWREEFTNFSRGGLSYVGVYNSKQSRLYYYKKNNFSLNQVPDFANKFFLSKNEDQFTSYDMDKGYIFQYRRQNFLGKPYYFGIIARVGVGLKNDILETFAVVRQVKQFELLLAPFQVFIIILLIYLYSQIFSILAIIFYYGSNRYISPIAELIRATRQIIQGDYQLSLSRLTKRMGNNEIKDLLNSFSMMSQELVNSRKRLERISNIEAWKEVSQKLAHEIKNPLTPMLLAKEHIEQCLIKTDLKTYHHLQENFFFIETEIKRIQTLLDEFNILSQQKLIHLEWVDIRHILRNLKSLVANYSFINWIEEIRYQKPVYMDKGKMLGVFINLIRNSIESLDQLKKSGIVRPYTIKVVVYSEALVTSPQDSERLGYRNWVFEVWDNGVGIPEEKRNEIFKPYITYKSKGTGLGLTICHDIVSLHQGEIENFSFVEKKPLYETKSLLDANPADVNSESYQWTVFKVTLPTADK